MADENPQQPANPTPENPPANPPANPENPPQQNQPTRTPETLETQTATPTDDATKNATAAGTEGAKTDGTATQAAATPAVSKEDEEKYNYANANEYKGNTFINVELAKVDEGIDAKTTFNKEFDMKIECFFVPKFNKGADFCNRDNIIRLPYSEQVKSIIMEDSLDRIGMKAQVEVTNMGSSLEGIFERHNNYYFVINFTQYVSGGSIKYEPYIFDISSVSTITKGYKGDKKVVIHLVDVITSILQSHSIASFIKFEGTEVTKCKNYKLLFSKIINYVKKYIKINTDNYFEFKKDVLYDDLTFFNGSEKLNGYDGDLQLGELITASFNKVDRNASIWEAMTQFLKDCVTSIKMNDQMKEQFESIGDVLIPFFFKEEYADRNAVYYNLWNGGDGTDTSKNEETEEPGESKPSAAVAAEAAGTQGTDDKNQSGTGQGQGSGSGTGQGTGGNPPANPQNPQQPANPTPENPSNPPATRNATDGNQSVTGDGSQNGQGGNQSGSGNNNGNQTGGGNKDNPTTLESTSTGGNNNANGTAATAATAATANSSNTAKATETVKPPTVIEMYDVALDSYGGKSNTLALRNITMRDFFMPFYLCFSYTRNGGPYVFEDINDGGIAMSTLNGKHNDNLQSLTFHSIDKSTVDKRWKNAIFLSVNGSGSDCTLVFFDWFYKFFLKAFLNSSKVGGTSKYISNVIPDFYLFSLRHGVGYASDAKANTFNNLFDEYNAYTVALDTKDTANEALREMGKNLASLVLLNDSYKFSLKGNLLRRPNEIMRLNVDGGMNDGSDMQLPIFTNISGDSSLFVYIRQVTHVFTGDSYTNNIVASKICETA